MFNRVLLPCLLLGLALHASPASAHAVLKLVGQAAQPLQVKSLAADVTIEGQFATTRLTVTYRNETGQRTEADFLYVLPPETIVTSFAYWYGEEKVPARIVEKEQAEAIYRYITARLRDPALVEMVGKNRFRARIFPVMPDADLKVEMTFAQVLPADADGAVYTLPLVDEPREALESLHVEAHVKADTSIQQISDNLGLPITQDAEGYRVRLSAEHFRPPKDLRIRLRRSPRLLQAVLYAAPSGSRDGFFVLALTPDRVVKGPSVRIRGVATYDVLPARPARVDAHTTLTVVGRYRGSGRATATLVGRTVAGSRWSDSQPVTFGAKAEPNNVATKLWAAREIEQLATRETNRQAVILLSERFGIPSRFTSWLAVPKAEMQRYEEERVGAERDALAHRLAARIARGQGRTRAAREMRRRLAQLCRRTGTSLQETLQEVLQSELYESKRSLANRLALLSASGNGPAARRVRRRLVRLCQQDGTRPSEVLEPSFETRMSSLAFDLARERHDSHPRISRIALLQRQLARLGRASHLATRDYVTSAEQNWRRTQDVIVRQQLEEALAKDNEPAAQRLEAQLTQLDGQINGKQYADDRIERLKARAGRARVEKAIEERKRQGLPVTRDLEAQRDRLATREEQLRVRMGDPLISISAPRDARRVVAVLPGGEIRPLSFELREGRWQARFDIPAYAHEGDYIVTVIVVLKDGTRRVLALHYQVDLTPPAGAGRAVVTAAGSHLRLDVEASADTARAVALLPWGQRVELTPVPHSHRYTGAIPLPAGAAMHAISIACVLTDRAHNRSVIGIWSG